VPNECHCLQPKRRGSEVPIGFYDPGCSLSLERAMFGYVLFVHHGSAAVTDGHDDYYKHPNRVDEWQQY